jgi:hypothetical protein
VSQANEKEYMKEHPLPAEYLRQIATKTALFHLFQGRAVFFNELPFI